MAINLSRVKKAHFIGIGGVGLSAIARFFLFEGKTVSGSDLTLTSPIIAELKKHGAKINRGHRASQVPVDADLVIYSLAVAENNPELKIARKRGVPAISYPETLGLVSAEKYTIAVAGTHGKTTTAAMLAQIFRAAKLDPTVILGSFLAGKKTNLLVGQSRYLIVEACEYKRSFLNLLPRILVITNIDNDHLDYYKNLAAIRRAFGRLASKVGRSGKVIREKEYRRIKLPIKLMVSGEHNQRNAQAAIAAAKAVGVSERLARQALRGFRAPWRRFEYKGRTKVGALIYDDYAHHPTEIQATLAAAREKFPRRRIIVVFQPHLYSRTKLLFGDFVASFDRADELVILPIYAAREKRDPKVTSQSLAQAIGARGLPTRYFDSFKTARNYLHRRLRRGDLLLTMGAGDVYNIGQRLLDKN